MIYAGRNENFFRNIWVSFSRFLLCLSCLAISTPAFAQLTADSVLEYDNLALENIDERLAPLGDDLMGDSIDLNTGALVFSHTDVSLPGNSALEVAIRRTRTPDFPFPHIDAAASEILFGHYDKEISKTSPFSDWSLEVPHISFTVPFAIPETGPVDPVSAIAAKASICDGFGGYTGTIATVRAPAIGPVYTGFIDGEGGGQLEDAQFLAGDDASNGIELNIPGIGSKKFLHNPNPDIWPAGSNVDLVTKDYWTADCGSSSNTKLTVKAPNGDTYIFDQFHIRAETGREVSGVYSELADPGDPQKRWYSAAGRVNLTFLVSEVRDIHGNWVRYAYDNEGWLTRIHANDGREIDVSYNDDGYISQITANDRVWSYEYETGPHSQHHIGLSKVILPDDREWNFEFTPHVVEASPKIDCAAPDATWTVTHPSGMEGEFTFSETKHKTTRQQQLTQCQSEQIKNVRFFETMSVAEKKLTHATTPQAVWQFNYMGDASSENSSKWGEVTSPDGTRMREYFSIISGNTLQSETFAPNNTRIRHVDYDYIEGPVIGETWLENGFDPAIFNKELGKRYTTPFQVVKTVTSQDGDVSTSESDYNIDPKSDDYSYGFPTENRIYSSVTPAAREIETSYSHNLTNWILGLRSAVKFTGTEVTSFCLLYTSPSPRDRTRSRMPSSA